MEKDPENQELINQMNELVSKRNETIHLKDTVVPAKLKKLMDYSKYEFYIDFTKDKSKFWFAGNIPAQIHNLKAKQQKLIAIKEFIKELLALSHPRLPNEITANSLETSEESRSEDSKLARTPKQVASDKIKQGMTWEMGRSDPGSDSSLKQLNESFISLYPLAGTAESMGDARYMPSFFKAEGTNSAMHSAIDYSADLNFNAELSEL